MVEIKVEKVNAERTNVRFAVYAQSKLWLKVLFARDPASGRIHSLFRFREFYDEQGRLANAGKTVFIPDKVFKKLVRHAFAILK